MASSSDSNASDTVADVFSMPIPPSRMVIFSILLTLLIPSIICSVYLFYKFIRRRDIRQRPNNLIIICLVIVNFIQATTELPLSLTFLRLNRPAVSSDVFCQWWSFISAVLYGIGLWMMAVGSIERYLFIFHSQILNKHTLLLRYLPLVWSFLLPIGLYIFLDFLFPCKNSYYYFLFWCGASCYMNSRIWSVVSWLLNNGGIPVFILVITNIILTTKIMCHKRRMQQTQIWSKNARMFFQLVSVASLYAVCWMPFLVSGQIMMFSVPQSPTALFLFMEYFVYLPYIAVTLCPFVCLFGLWRDLHDGKSFMNVIFRRHRVGVKSTGTTRSVVTRTTK